MTSKAVASPGRWDDRSSSPDPLALSPHTSPIKSAPRASQRVTRPLAERNTNTPKMDLFADVPLLSRTSPSKSIIMDTPQRGGSSPWRIRVTVEAEPAEGPTEEGKSPTRAPVSRVTTTTVPLKGSDESSPVKRGRGRPRKSAGTSPAPKKRSGTPVRRRRKSITRSPDEHEDDDDLTFGEVVIQPKKRGRPRKSLATSAEVPQPIQAEATYGQSSSEEAEVTPESSAPSEAAGTQTPEDQKSSSEHEDHHNTPHTVPARLSSPSGPRSKTPGKLVKSRKGTPAKLAQSDAPNTHSSSYMGLAAMEPTKGADDARDAEMWRNMIGNQSYESFSDTGESDDEPGNVTVPDVIGEETMLQSEGFSMVSIDSLPSRQAKVSSPAKQPTPRSNPTMPDKAIYQSIAPEMTNDLPPQPSLQQAGDVSAISVSYMPSSPPVRLPQRTPSANLFHAPSAPPCIEQSQVNFAEQPTPRLGSVVKAGIALQGVVNGNNRGTFDRRLSDDVREEDQRRRLDSLFSQFDSGTSRALRAGLRLGEQLAQRAQSRVTTRESTSDPEQEESQATRPATGLGLDEDIFANARANVSAASARLLTPEENEDYALHVPPARALSSTRKSVDRHSLKVHSQQDIQLVSPAKSQDNSIWETDATPSPRTTTEARPDATSAPHTGRVESRYPGEASEDYWARERKAIRKQIDEANTSRLINSDDGKADQQLTSEAFGDIWEEAASSSPTSIPPEKASSAKGKDRASSPPAVERTVDFSTRAKDSFNISLQSEKRRRSQGTAAEQRKSPQSLTKPQMRQKQSALGSRADMRERRAARIAKERASKSPEQRAAIALGTPGSSGESDDPGSFWQSNLPAVFKKSGDAPAAEKVDLSLLEGQDSSPLIKHLPSAKRSARTRQVQRTFAANVPTRGSPLKQQVVFTSPAIVEPSSYLAEKISRSRHDITDQDVTADTMTSDMRQLKAEMTAHPDSAGRFDGADEASEYDDEEEEEAEEEAGEEEDMEMEEASHLDDHPELECATCQHRTHYVPTFSSPHTTRSRGPVSSRPSTVSPYKPKPRPRVAPAPATAATSAPAKSSPEPETTQTQSGLFSKIWTSLPSFSAAPTPAAPPLHELAEPLDKLPKHFPWTKTHYKVLDIGLYRKWKKHPDMFSPSLSVNDGLLAQTFLHPRDRDDANPRRKVALTAYDTMEITKWGYTVRVTKEMLVLCAIFIQRLELEDQDEYVRVTGKEIDGYSDEDGTTGRKIWALDVVKQLFTLIAGDMVRRDEKKGLPIRRTGGMDIQWPEGFEGMLV